MIPKITSMEEYHAEYKRSLEDPDGFWAVIADQFKWRQKWDTVRSGDFSDLNISWFKGGKLNISENCLDRHLDTQEDKAAIIWEPNNPDEEGIKLSYRELHTEVCKFSNVLLNNGVKKGDRVCIYMPMVPELAIAVLACARIGAIHSVVFGGFSAKSLADRINDASCALLITADGTMRGSKEVDLKRISDEAMNNTPSIKTCIVLQRTFTEISMKEGRDIWYHDEMKDASADHEVVVVDAEDPLFILYTSGSTGKPKGILHTTAGYMVYAAYSFLNVFQYEPNDIYWCTADIGWITGHSYIVYGPLLNGATTLMFEGIPTYPDAGRFWDVVAKYNVSIFYTAPTAIRALQAYGLEYVQGKELDSLRILGTVGEPINEEAWQWYHKYVGKERCPIVDTWWQTETGGILISPLAGITPLKPSFATLPLPGIQPAIVDHSGNILEGNDIEGNLCMIDHWPGLTRTLYGDHERFKETYFSAYPGKYFTGDGCKRDEDGFYRITGRVDDVMNISGHRIGTAEVENAIDEHDSVCETAVVGFPHDIKGQGIYAYVVCYEQPGSEDTMRGEINTIVNEIIGPIARPDKIQFVEGLPKTRSGKIIRRILRKVAEGNTSDLGDTSTLLNPDVVEDIKGGAM